MSNEKFIRVLNEVASLLEKGLEESRGSVGLTREDCDCFRALRDKVAYALGVIDFNREIEEEVHE